jgi:predicted nucleic acid-binding protein
VKVLVDTNVLVRLANPADANQSTAFNALAALAAAGYTPCLVPQAIYEYWVVATRPVDKNGLGYSIDMVVRDLSKFDADFEILPDTADIFPEWRQLVADRRVLGKLAHDVRLVAAMIQHDVTHLLTFNAPDFKRFSEIETLDPVAVAKGNIASP